MASELPPGFRLDQPSGGTLPAGFAKDEQSWGAWVGEGAQDFARAGVNAATFGMTDRAMAALEAKARGTTYDDELNKNVGLSEAARERSPTASVAGDVAGSLVLPGFGAEALAVRAGTALANRGVRAAPALGRAIGYGVTGAGIGAAQGAGNTYTGNPWDYAQNALTGAAIALPLGAAGGAAFGARPRISKAEVPTAAQTEAEKIVAYRRLDNSPAEYTPGSFAQRADDVERTLRMRNAHETRSPQTFEALDQMRTQPTVAASGRQTVTPADMDFTRKLVTGDQLKGASGTDMATSRVVRNAIDDFIRNPPQGAVVPGTEVWAREASDISKRAHELNAAWKRQQFMDEILANARRSGGSKYSGLNFQNEVRNAYTNKLKESAGASQFSKAGFNQAETDAFDKFAMGSTGNNTLRYIDKVLGGGGGLGTAVTVGIPASGGVAGYFKDNPEAGTAAGLAAAALGHGLRRVGNRRAFADVKQLNDMVGMRNPLYRERVAAAGTLPGPGSSRAAQSARDAVALAVLNQIRQRESH